MPFRITLLFIALSFHFHVFAQENLKSSTIPQELKENANAVVRSNQIDIDITSRKSMKIKKQRIITVLNEYGMSHIGASEYFDNSTVIKSIEAVIYNSSGQEIKKIKRKDFTEESLSGSTVTDTKILYLNYVPLQYPFTVVFTSETESSNTAFVPSWQPVEGFFVSSELSSISVKCDPKLGFKYKEYNFGSIELVKEVADNKLLLSVKNILAYKNEDYTPFQKIKPQVLFGVDKFNLEGVDGVATDWKDFGGWIYNNLLKGTDELPAETQEKIKSLTANETDTLKKAKIVYEYVQSKTRYVSIQLGIGGWKPMRAKDVDRLGYGDCKALSNYTRALLKVIGIDSYYAVIYGDSSKRDLREDFVTMQGNHVVLAIPHNSNLVWLECTSQVAPFGFQGDFTDDRVALLVKPEGGELVRTGVYDIKTNSQYSKGNYAISANGSIEGSIIIESKGIQYDNKYFLGSKSKEDLEKYYKSSYSNINNLKIKKAELNNEKNTPSFTEDISITAESYCSFSGNRMIFAVNAFNQSGNVPQRYRTRNNPFEIARGYNDIDEVTISLPEGLTIEAMPQNTSLTGKFGEYKTEYTALSANQFLFKRTLIINNGYYEKNDYDAYRQFRENIARNDNAKIVLIKK